MKVATNEVLAIAIVRSLIDEGNRPGEGMPFPALKHQPNVLPLHTDDFDRGYQRALNIGWIETSRDGLFVKLTHLGFAEA